MPTPSNVGMLGLLRKDKIIPQFTGQLALLRYYWKMKNGD